MAQENIDVKVQSSGTKRVVVDINEIGNAAIDAQKRLDDMMKTLQKLAGGGLIGSLRSLQQTLDALGNTNLGRLQAQIQQLQAQSASLNTQVNRATGGFNLLGSGPLAGLLTLRNTIHGVMAALAVHQIMEWADAWIASAGKINIFAKTQEESNVIMERLFTIAQTSRQPLTAMADLYHLLTISGTDLGASQNQMLSVTDTVSKSLAIQGTSTTKARGALLQLSQSFGTGKVRAQEFNSMMQNIPLLLKTAAKYIDGAGGSTAKLRQIMIAGNLTSRQFFEAILKSSGDLDALFAKAPKTFAQGWIVLTNALERYLGKLNESLGVSAKFNELILFISNNLDTIGKLVLVIGAGIAGAFIPAAVMGMVAAMRLLLPLLLRAVVLLNANPFGVLAAAAVAAYAFGDSLNIGIDNTTTLRDLMIALGIVIKDTWGDIVSVASSIWTSIVNFAQDAYNVITKNTSEATALWGDSYTQFYADTGKGLSGFFMALAKTADAIGGLILGLSLAVVRAFEGLPGAFAEIGKSMYNKMVEWIEKIVNVTISGVNQLRGLTGMQLIDPLKLERQKVDENYFKNYGARISGAIDEGFDAQGGALQGKLHGLLLQAQQVSAEREQASKRSGAVNLDTPLGTPGLPAPDKNAAKRAAQDALASIREQLDKYKADAAAIVEAERHKEALLKDSYDRGVIDYRDYSSQLETMQQTSYLRQKDLLDQEKSLLVGKLSTLRASMQAKGSNDVEIATATKDITTKVQELDQALDKLNNKNQERLSDAMTKALAPSAELVRNSQKELEVAGLNTEQELRKIAAKENSNQLSERDQFIQEHILQLTDKYQDKISSIVELRRKMIEAGAFDDMSNPDVQKAWNNINDALDKWQAALGKIKQDAPAALGAAFDAGEVNRFAKDLNKAIVDALFDGGKDGAKGIRKAITAELKKPFVTIVQALMQPVTSALAGAIQGISSSVLGGGGAGAAGGAGGIGNILGSAGSLATLGSSIGTAFTAGSTSVGVMAGSIAGGGGLLGGAASALGAIGPIGWAGLAALAAYSLFGGKGGGPKTESGFGTGVPLRGDPTSARTITQGVQAQYASILGQIGMKAGQLDLGAFTAADPKGTAQTQFALNASLYGQNIYSRQTRTGGIENVGRSQEELTAAISEDSTRAVFAAIKATQGLSDTMRAILAPTDAYSSSLDEINAALTRATAAESQRKSLEETLFNLTHTDAEILAHQRDAELAALDDTNKALDQRIFGLQDEKKAQEEALAAQQEALTVQQAATDAFKNAGEVIANIRANVTDYLNKLNATPAGMLTPEQQLQNAYAQFNQQLARAQGGDATALDNITQTADQLLEAQKAFGASGPGTVDMINYVRQALGQLPEQVTTGEIVANAVTSGTVEMTTKLQEMINASNANAQAQVAATFAAASGVTMPDLSNIQFAPFAQSSEDLTEAVAELKEQMAQFTTVLAAYAQRDLAASQQVIDNTAQSADAAQRAASAASRQRVTVT